MIRKNAANGGGSRSGGNPPGLDMAMTVMVVVAAIGGAEQVGLWPAALDGAAGTIVPAAVVVVLAGWRAASRTGRALGAIWAELGWRRSSEARGSAGQNIGRGGEEGRTEDIEANASVLAVHLPDPTMFPPTPANDDEKDRPTAI